MKTIDGFHQESNSIMNQWHFAFNVSKNLISKNVELTFIFLRAFHHQILHSTINTIEWIWTIKQTSIRHFCSIFRIYLTKDSKVCEISCWLSKFNTCFYRLKSKSSFSKFFFHDQLSCVSESSRTMIRYIFEFDVKNVCRFDCRKHFYQL